jgi:site-specific recombinase XerD
LPGPSPATHSRRAASAAAQPWAAKPTRTTSLPPSLPIRDLFDADTDTGTDAETEPQAHAASTAKAATQGHLLFKTAFDAWMAQQDEQKAVRRATSRSVYRTIWSAFSAWCISQDLGLPTLSANDLERYIAHRAGLLKASHHAPTSEPSFSPRYAWRLLTLVDHVLVHHASTHAAEPNRCAHQLLHTKTEWRYANTPDYDRLPAYLEFDQAEDLICWVQANMPAWPGNHSDHQADDQADGQTDHQTAHPPGAAAAPGASSTPRRQTWVQARNRTSVALQLGSGLTPGEVRDLELEDVRRCPTTGAPLKLHIRAQSTTPAHEVPLASWSVPLLQNWLDLRQACGVTATVLFPGTRGSNAWSKVSQFEAAQATLLEAGIPAHTLRGSFMLRHTFALRQLHAGIEPQRLASWLGIVDLKRLNPYFSISYGPQRPV